MTTSAILVTGGAGYIGSHTCKALAKAGYLPITIDTLETGHRDFVRWGPLVEADISDTPAVVRTCREFGVKAAIHFAAYSLVGESVVEPERYYRNNVGGSLSLLSALRESRVNALVFSSTCAVYGAPQKQPIAEDTPTAPVNPYGASKLMVERMLQDFGAAYGLRSVILRYFNACGADPDAEIGENRKIETHLIPRALMWLQGYIEEFQVFGTDFPTADGTAVRDYIHVSDLASAHVLALNQLLSDAPGGIFNLGTGRGFSVREVLGEISRVTRQAVPQVAGPRRAGDPALLVADGTRARQELGFVPSRSSLKEIIASAWAWHLKAHPRRNARP